MPGLWGGLGEAFRLLLVGDVSCGQPLSVLAKMLLPRSDHADFFEPIRLLSVANESPLGVPV